MGTPVEVTVKLPDEPSTKLVPSAEVIEGGPSTVKVKDWVASGLMPLAAVMVRVKMPWTVGVPAREAVPSPLSVKVTPAGRSPVSDSVAVGTPVETTVKLPAEPSVNVVELPLVMVGATSTVKVKVWVAFGLMPLEAPMENV